MNGINDSFSGLEGNRMFEQAPNRAFAKPLPRDLPRSNNNLQSRGIYTTKQATLLCTTP